MTVQDGTSTALPAPRSWAEDLNTYRSTRGSRSFATTSAPAKSFGRTCLVPFADTKHSLYPYNDFPKFDGGDRTRQEGGVQSERYFRHGWGDTSLLKEEGYAGVPHPRGHRGDTPSGKGQPPCPHAKDGRNGLFGVLQQSEQGGMDSWIGNALIEPTKGKRALQAPTDPKGRRGLFDVLSSCHPGKPSDDSWLGNALIDPARGKASVPGPEQRRGRRDLTDTFTQSILREPNRAELLLKGADPLSDAWCGHMLIDPNRGKLTVHSAASGELLIGAAFKPPVPHDFSDFPKRHAKLVETSFHDTAHLVLNGTAKLDPNDLKRGKRELPESVGTRLDQRKDLYANMQYRPLNGVEQTVFAKAIDDGKVTGKRHMDAPGSQAFGKGPDMLAWRPEHAVGQFVPYAKLAQEGRSTKPVSLVPGGTMGRPMPIPRTLSLSSTARF